MSDIERDLISKILIERNLADVADGGVTPSYFATHEHREAYKAILEHQAKYSSVPSTEAFLRTFDPTYRITEPSDPLAFYVDELTAEYEYFLVEDGLSRAVDEFEERGDVSAARRTLNDTLNLLNREINRSRVVDITSTGDRRMERYREYSKSNGALKGISSGFASIDAATGGWQKKQLITMVGPPKAGKSTMMLLSTMAAHAGFYRPLFIGFEMSNEEQEERHDAIRAGISHKRLRDGTLSGEEFRSMEKMMRRMELMPALIFSEDASSTSTLSGVSAIAEKFHPDAVFIDGVYMMEDDHGEKKGSPQALTNITRGAKVMAKAMDIPVIISTQVLEWKMDRKKGVTSSSIGYSSSFFQDSDVLIGVERTDDDQINKVKILDGRNVKRMETYVQWNWETGDFVELEGMDEDEEDPQF